MAAPPSFRASGQRRALNIYADLQMRGNLQRLRIFRPIATKDSRLKPTKSVFIAPDTGETITGYLVEEVDGRVARTRRAYKGLETVGMDQSAVSELEWVVSLYEGTTVRHKDYIVTVDGHRIEAVIVTPHSIYPHRTWVVGRLAQ